MNDEHADNMDSPAVDEDLLQEIWDFVRPQLEEGKEFVRYTDIQKHLNLSRKTLQIHMDELYELGYGQIALTRRDTRSEHGKQGGETDMDPGKNPFPPLY